jgi:putative acetyltransferase
MLIVRSSPFDLNFHMLVSELDKELWDRYPQSQATYDAFNKIDEHARIVLAFENGIAVGCGCWKITDVANTSEIKRMYVKRSLRGRGIAGLVLNELENWSKEENYTTCRLETGINQPEAIRLYEKTGYQRMANYEPYVGLPESVCMQKVLA